MKVKTAEIGVYSLITQTEHGEIIQIGISDLQSNLLQFFLAGLSSKKAFVEMPKEYNLQVVGEYFINPRCTNDLFHNLLKQMQDWLFLNSDLEIEKIVDLKEAFDMQNISHEIVEIILNKVKITLKSRGFSKETILNNRGLIGATIEDVIVELFKQTIESSKETPNLTNNFWDDWDEEKRCFVACNPDVVKSGQCSCVREVCNHNNKRVIGGNQTQLKCLDCGKNLV